MGLQKSNIMGLRATSVKKYEIQFGDTSGFNYGVDTLSNIIGEHCNDFFCGSDGEPSSNEIWEVNKEEYKAMLDKLDAMDKRKLEKKIRTEWLSCVLEEDKKTYTPEYVLRVLHGFYDDTPEDSNYVRIAWL